MVPYLEISIEVCGWQVGHLASFSAKSSLVNMSLYYLAHDNFIHAANLSSLKWVMAEND